MTGPEAPAVNDLRPRTVGEILDASFAVYRRRFGRLLLVATILGAPTLLVALVVAAPQGEHTRDLFTLASEMFDDAMHGRRGRPEDFLERNERMQEIAWSLRGWAYLQGLIQSFARGVTAVAMAIVAWEVLHRRDVPPIAELVTRSLRRSVPAAGLYFVVFVLTSECLVCFPLPITVGALFAPACAVLALEQGPIERSVRESGLPRFLASIVGTCLAGFDAIGRACVLGWHAMSVVRSTFLVCVTLLLLSFLDMLVGAALGIAFESFAVFFVAQHWVELLLLPQIGLAFAFWYVELRVRREAIDLAPSVIPAIVPAPLAAA